MSQEHESPKNSDPSAQFESGRAWQKYGVGAILNRLGKRIERKQYIYTTTPQVISGFEDLIDEPLGADLVYNTQGTAHQLAFALSLSSHAAVDRVMDANSTLAGEDAVRVLRHEQALSGIKIMDLACGLPTFALAARSLGAVVYVADIRKPADKYISQLNGFVHVDLNAANAAVRIKRETGGDFDLVTENIVGPTPNAPEEISEIDPKKIELIAAMLLKSGGYLYRPTHAGASILRKK